MKHFTPYTDRIAKIAPTYDPGQIEAFMRLEHSTLDALYPAKFKREVQIACQCIDADPVGAERIAASYGL